MRARVEKVDVLGWNKSWELFYNCYFHTHDIHWIIFLPIFLRMNENFNYCQERKTTCTLWIYSKSKKRQTYLNTKSQILSKKQDNYRHVFIHKKQDTLRYTIFHEIFELGIYIQKVSHFALRDVFIFKKLDTSQKAR